MKTLGNPTITIKDRQGYNGTYEIDQAYAFNEPEDFFALLAFNENEQYLLQYGDEYLGIFNNKEAAIYHLIEYMAYEIHEARSKPPPIANN